MLIRENPRVSLIQEAIGRIRDAEKDRAEKAQAERKRQYDEMLKSLTQFFGSDVQSPSDLYLEGLATRELLALKKEKVVIYRDGNWDYGTAYLLTCEGSVVVANIIAGTHVLTNEVLPPNKLADELFAKGVAFDQVLRNVRTAVDVLIAGTDKNETISSVSSTLPKQTYPAIGGIATIEGKQFAFPVATGIGLVMLDGQPALVEFSCPSETVPPQGSGRVLARGEMVAKIYDGTPYVVA